MRTLAKTPRPLDKYGMIEPSLHGPQYLGRRYLVVNVRGGLMNQALEIWTALLMAQRLNRTVVLPQVRARVPKEYIYAHDTNTPLGPFDYLWDETHFVHCARHSIETPNLIDVNQTHHKVQIFSKHIYDIEQHEGIMYLLDEMSPLILSWFRGSEETMPNTSKSSIRSH